MSFNQVNNKSSNEIITTETATATYIFRTNGENEGKKSEQSLHDNRLFYIIPTTTVSMLCVSFGIMLGWPSPTYIELLDPETSPLPITMVQSPMIAGFLMFGVIFATPFSTWKFQTTKYSILLGLLLIDLGWLLLWLSTNVPHLLMSRFLIGTGFGYGLGQVKQYISEMCTKNRAKILLNFLNCYILVGVLLAYVMGLYLEFRRFSLAAVLLTGFLLMLVALVPHSPEEYRRLGKVEKARKIQRKLYALNSAHSENIIEEQPAVLNLRKLLKTGQKSIFVLILVVFSQQFSGGPATVVYCQFMFANFGIEMASYFAVIYGLVYLVAYTIGTFFIAKLENKKLLLVVSSVVLCFVLSANVAVLIYKIGDEFVPSALMLVYVFCYGLGWASVPNTLVAHLFEEKFRSAASHLQLMLFCINAVVNTKLFQVFYNAFEFWTIFALFDAVSLFGLFVALVLVPSKPLF